MSAEFARFIKTEEIKFKYAKGMRDIIGNEIHPYHEIFFYIGGDAKFVSESGTEKLLPYTTIIIPKETFHCFVVSGNEEDYCRCVFNFENVSELDTIISDKMNRIFLLRDDAVSELFLKLKELTDISMTKTEKEVLLKSLFAQILVYIKEQEQHSFEVHLHPVTEKIVRYIEKNIDKPLNITALANELYISESHLAHIFKKDLHISIHKYILEKRLVLANKKIKSSVSPTQAALECGFQDYSGFYKQYKKMFGIPPSKSGYK
ncbi:MAG: helix-turn-helix transcriptional regulator [Clostridia bacterium]|nr:helix-turn-helix transcriptional regulator [Clostridia bacterium]MBQ9997691.1 helix-turn-helix transcriptional regulator [Clostridia bacterium]